MRTLVFLLMLTSPTGTGTASRAPDVSGEWQLEMSWSQGVTSTGRCSFTQEGRKLGGWCGGSDRYAIAGEVVDHKLSWQFEVESDGNGGRMEFVGEVNEEGTTIEGSCSIVGGQDGTFTMKKQA
jgi:hypothetical protein